MGASSCILMTSGTFMLAPSSQGYLSLLAVSNFEISSTFASVSPILSRPPIKQALRNSSMSKLKDSPLDLQKGLC